MDTKIIETLVKEFNRLSKGAIDFNKYTWYSITHHSTGIEGSTLTESQVIKLLDYGKPAANKPFEEHLMVTDYFKALQYIIEQAEKKRPLNAAFIREIGSMVMRNTGSVINTVAGSYNTSEGEFRKGSVRAGTRLFPDFKKVPDLINDLCARTDKRMKAARTFEEKCDIAFTFHFELVSIHPFGDGNGRTSRLLMNYIQAYFGLPLSVVYKAHRIRYISALEKARKKESVRPFILFMYGQYEKFLKQEISELKRKV
jgi:Fic family protein